MKTEGNGSSTGHEGRVSFFDDSSEQTREADDPGRAEPWPAGRADDTVVYAPPALVPRVLLRWRPILAVAVVAAVLAGVFGLVRPAEYRAQALVQLGSGAADLVTGSASPQEDVERRIATESEILTSDRVRAAAESAVRRDLPAVEVSRESTSSLLSVAVTTDDPDAAAEDADAYVEAYLQLSSTRTRDQLEPAIDVLRTRLVNIAGTLEELQTTLENTPTTTTGTDPGTDAIQARVDNLLEQRSETNGNIDRLEGAAAIGSLDVRSFADAAPPSRPSSVPPLRLALLGLVVGLVAGGLLAAALPLGSRRRPRA